MSDERIEAPDIMGDGQTAASHDTAARADQPDKVQDATAVTEAVQAATSQIQAVTETAASQIQAVTETAASQIEAAKDATVCAAQTVAESAFKLQQAVEQMALPDSAPAVLPDNDIKEVPAMHPEVQEVVDRLKEALATGTAAEPAAVSEEPAAPASSAAISPQLALEVIKANIEGTGAGAASFEQPAPSASAPAAPDAEYGGKAKRREKPSPYMMAALLAQPHILIALLFIVMAIYDTRTELSALKKSAGSPAKAESSQFFWPPISAEVVPFSNDAAIYDAILGKQMAGLKNRPAKEAILEVLRESNAVSSAIQRNIDVLKKRGKPERDAVVEGFLSDTVVSAVYNELPEQFRQAAGIKEMIRAELETISSYAKDNFR